MLPDREAPIDFRGDTEVYLREGKADLSSVVEHLRQHGCLQEAGGTGCLEDLLRKSDSLNVEYCCQVVAERCLQRGMLEIAHSIWEEMQKEHPSSRDLLEDTAERVNQLWDRVLPAGSFERVDGVVAEALELVDSTHAGKLGGLSTGFSDLDSFTNGLVNGNLVLVGGGFHCGTLPFALSMARHIALHNRKPVAIVSHQSQAVGITKQVLCAEAQIDAFKMRNGRLKEAEMGRLRGKAGRLEKAPLFVGDLPNPTITELRIMLRHLHRKERLELVIIDAPDTFRLLGGGSDARTRAAWQLKRLAQELHLPVVVLLDSPKMGCNDRDLRPQLIDLSEAGYEAMTQASDLILLVYRPEMYDVKCGDDTDWEGIGQIIIARNRRNTLGSVYLNFDAKTETFTDIASDWQPESD